MNSPQNTKEALMEHRQHFELYNIGCWMQRVFSVSLCFLLDDNREILIYSRLQFRLGL